MACGMHGMRGMTCDMGGVENGRRPVADVASVDRSICSADLVVDGGGMVGIGGMGVMDRGNVGTRLVGVVAAEGGGGGRCFDLCRDAIGYLILVVNASPIEGDVRAWLHSAS